MHVEYSSIKNITKLIAPTHTGEPFGSVERFMLSELNVLPKCEGRVFTTSRSLIPVFKDHFPTLIRQYLGLFEYYYEHRLLFNSIVGKSLPVEFKRFIFGMCLTCSQSITYNFRCGHVSLHSGADNSQSLYGILYNLIRDTVESVGSGIYVADIFETMHDYLVPLIKSDGSIVLTDDVGFDHQSEPGLFPKLGYARKHDINLSAQNISANIPERYTNDFLIPTFDSLARVFTAINHKVKKIINRYRDELEGQVDITDLDKIHHILTDICNYHHAIKTANSGS